MTNILSLRLPDQEELSRTMSFAGVTITINKDGEVIIDGAKSLNIKTENFDLEAEKISIRATESYDLNVDGKVYFGASEPVIIQSQKIHFNPDIRIDSEGNKYAASGYKEKV